MAEKSLKEKTVNGVIWSGVEKMFSKLLTLVFSILIARQLVPEDYGVVAMLNIFLAVSQSFIDSGFAAACVRKLNRTEDDFNTMFWFNVIASVFFYVVLWFLAPFLADFYDTPILKSICRISSLTLIIGSLRGVHSIKLSIDVNFKSFAIVSIIASTIGGIVGLFLAYKGFGVWTLVYQQLISAILWTILLWIIVHWAPRLRFSLDSFKELFSFGSKLLGAGLLNALYNNIYPLVIGKAFTSKDLGVYTKAGSFSDFASVNVSSVLMPVFYPVFSTLQNDKERLAQYYFRSVSLMCYIIFPLCFGLAALSGPFVRVILTEHWYGMVPVLRILCFATILYPFHEMSMNVLKVLGKSDVLLKIEVVVKVLGLLVLIASIPFGIYGVCAGRVLASLLTYIIDIFAVSKYLGVSISRQILCFKNGGILSFVMSAVVFASISLLPLNNLKLFIGLLVGLIFYFTLSVILKIKEFEELYAIILLKARGVSKV